MDKSTGPARNVHSLHPTNRGEGLRPSHHLKYIFSTRCEAHLVVATSIESVALHDLAHASPGVGRVPCPMVRMLIEATWQSRWSVRTACRAPLSSDGQRFLVVRARNGLQLYWLFASFAFEVDYGLLGVSRNIFAVELLRISLLLCHQAGIGKFVPTTLRGR